ncbi:MAG: hypothetical protein V1735_00940 [Nanoarchaeota archaeon]
MKRGQASTEFLMVTAIAFLILIPTAYLFYSESFKSADRISQAKLNEIGNNIVNTAQSIYYVGPPSKTTLADTMPEGVKNISIRSGADFSELTFALQKGGETAFFSKVRLKGNFSEGAASQGNKLIRLEAKEGYVNITIT